MMNSSGRRSTHAIRLRERTLALAGLWRNRTARFAVKTAVGLLVLAAVGRHVHVTWQRLRERGGSLHVEPGWIALSLLLYVAGLAVFGVFFQRILRASPSAVGLAPAVRAYVISHLGKYVPGKALVVVLRVALVVPYGARTATSAFAAVYETLVMMCGGAVVAALGFSLGLAVGPGAGRRELWPLAASLALGAMLLLVVDPAVFPRLSRFLSLPFKGLGPDVLPRFSRRLEAEGLGCAVLGWMLWGLSLVAVIRALSAGGVSPSQWPVVFASAALATVGGFAVAVLPGGLGVREGILMATLAPAVGDELAVLASLALRLTWVVGEVAAAGVLSVCKPRVPESLLSRVPTP